MNKFRSPPAPPPIAAIISAISSSMPGGIGKAQSKIQMEPETGVTFNDVAGCDGSKLELTEVVDFLKNPGKYAALGAKVPRGCLMAWMLGRWSACGNSCVVDSQHTLKN